MKELKTSVICCLLMIFFITGFSQVLQLRKIETNQQLFLPRINAIIRDHHGLMWIGTDDGLFRYDGEQFLTVQNPVDLGGRKIFCLLEDDNHQIWIGTDKGLFTLHDSKRYPDMHIMVAPERLSSHVVLSIAKSPRWGIICSTQEGSIYQLTQEGKAKKITQLLEGANPITIAKIHFDDKRRLWAGSVIAGIFQLDTTGAVVKHFALPTQLNDFEIDVEAERIIVAGIDHLYSVNINTEEVEYIELPGLSASRFTTFFRFFRESGSPYLWIGHNEPRLWKYNINDGHCVDFSRQFSFVAPQHTRISSLYIDHINRLWIGSNTGLYASHQRRNLFDIISFSGEGKAGYLSTRAIYDADDSTLYLGSYQGFFQYNKKNKKATPQYFFNDDEKAWKNPIAYDILPGDGDTLLIASEGGGLLKYNAKTSTFVPSIPISRFKAMGSNQKRIQQWSLCLKRDDNNRLWIGTIKGLFFKDPGKEIDIFRNEVSGTLINAQVKALLNSSHGLWVGSGSGLFFIDKQTGEAQRAITPDIKVNALYNDSEHILWIGTQGSGLYRFNTHTQQLNHYSTHDGMPHNDVNAILPGSDQALWISTNQGLSRFDTLNKVFHNFFVEDGLPDNEFNHSSATVGLDGKLYFGGIQGVVSFDPLSFTYPDQKPVLIITELRQHNGKDNATTVSNVGLVHELAIKLDYQDKFFSISFLLDDFINKEKVQYKYMLAGIHNQWQELGNTNYIQFAGLSAGDYRLKIKAMGSRGTLDTDEIEVPVHIGQAFYDTAWAYMTYATLFAFILYGIFKIHFNRLNLKKQLAIEHDQTERLRELTILKSRLFTNIAHELRTPLTLIEGPAQLIAAESRNKSIKEHAFIIHQHSQKMMNLVNELLEIARIEAGVEKLKIAQRDVINCMKSLIDTLRPAADRKNIQINFNCSAASIIADVDEDKLCKIFINVISNAIKFTGNKGEVNIGMRLADKSGTPEKLLIVTVSDNGIGIDQNKLPHIFDRFYQAENSGPEGGIGIGLALVKELVELCEGSISVESQKGLGSTFIIRLPVLLSEAGLKKESTTQLSEDTAMIPDKEKKERSVALVVEDNPDVLEFVERCLSKDYEVIKANSGAEALQYAIETIPDVIITDVMMPGMNGKTFCRYIKTNTLTSHIPVVMLTAKDTAEDKIEGLQTGADAYITKPFNPKELKLILKNLLTLKQETILAAGKSKTQSVQNVRISPDQQFYNDILKLIEANLDNTEFSVDDILQAKGISKTQLHRKLKAIAGQSTGKLIRTIRLQRGLELLTTSDITISEIAYRVGFTSPSYFTECFHEEFGYTPNSVRS